MLEKSGVDWGLEGRKKGRPETYIVEYMWMVLDFISFLTKAIITSISSFDHPEA